MFNHLYDSKTKRYVCNKENPMPKNAPDWTRWKHIQAKCVGGNYEGDADDYECPVCKSQWRTYCY